MAIVAGDFQVQAYLQGISGLPQDRFVNTFAVKHVGPLPLSFVGLTNTLRDFYQKLQNLIPAAEVQEENALTCSVYELTDPKPRPPVFVQQYDLSLGSARPLPTEVSLCSSFAAAAAPGVHPARRRGRIYFGPLTISTNSPSGNSRPSTFLIDELSDATNELASELTTEGWDLCVWSRRDDTLFPVARGWVDNAWDTQRRRGVDSSSRTSWTISP